jgi:hypothetical protein
MTDKDCIESDLFSGSFFLSIFGVHFEKDGKTAEKDFLRTEPVSYSTKERDCD